MGSPKKCINKMAEKYIRLSIHFAFKEIFHGGLWQMPGAEFPFFSAYKEN